MTVVTMAAFSAHAQTDSSTTNTPATKPAPRPRAKAFSGTIASVDSDAKTITVTLTNGVPQTYHINSKTRITKDMEPATLASATAGLKVRVYAKKDDDGSMVATSVAIGQLRRSAPPASTPPASTPPASDSNK
jgi:hypothetical protein